MTKAKTGLSIVAIGAALLLAGCESWPDSLNPNKWIDYSDPNATVKGPEKTYPKLSSVPERPPPRDEAAQKEAENQLQADRAAGRAVAAPPAAEGLIADRESARYTDETLRREEPKAAAAPAPTPPPVQQAARSELPAPPRAAPAPQRPQAAAPPPPPPATTSAPATTQPASPAPAPLAALPSAPPPPAAPAAAPPAPAVVAMAPVRSPGDPPPRSGAAPSRSSNLVWGSPPSDIALAQEQRGSAARLMARPGGPVASVMFAAGSSKVTPTDEALLRRVAEQYLRSGGTIAVIGHASQTAGDRTNVRRQIANFSVSLDRATAVAQALQRYGVPGEAIAISAQIDGVALNDAEGWRADVFLR